MAKNKNGTITGNMPSGTPYNPASNYGRTKSEVYNNTSAGQHSIQQDPNAYLGNFFKANGINTDSATPSPFSAWLKNNYMGQIQGDYDRAKAINPELSFAHYGQTRGINTDPALQGGGNTATPLNTGNVYTSNSGIAPSAVMAAHGKKNKPPAFQAYAQGVVQGTSGAMEMARARHDWQKLTPEARGIAPQGYAFGPAGWSVY